jgi:seryl-tRNA synthetase
MAKGKKEEAETKKGEVASLKALLQPIAEKLADTEKQLTDKLVLLPNLPSDKVPSGKTPADNVVVREGGNKPKLSADAIPHWDLAKKYNLIDFELGINHRQRFSVYKNKGPNFSGH